MWTESYDPLDPNGNITVKWDINSWTPEGYVVSFFFASLCWFSLKHEVHSFHAHYLSNTTSRTILEMLYPLDNMRVLYQFLGRATIGLQFNFALRKILAPIMTASTVRVLRCIWRDCWIRWN